MCVLVCALTVSCSRSSQERGIGLPPGSSAEGARVDVAADLDGSVRADVPAVGMLEGGPGSLTPGATLHVTPVAVSGSPGVVDQVPIVSVGTGVMVDVEDGRIEKALTLVFREAVADVDSSLVALHRDDDGGWELLPATLSSGDRLTVVTNRFSIVTWGVAKILKPVGDFIAAKLAGRTSPSKCEGTPPWASADGSPSGSTHSCARRGKALSDGTEIAELEIKSNRGTYQWVDLPSALTREYVWVEDQTDLVRAMIRKTFNRGEAVLLAPGQRITVGYRQPTAPSQLRFRTYVDTLSGFLTIGRLAVDAATDDTVDKTGGYLAVLSCFGVVKFDLTNPDSPTRLQHPELLSSLIPCVIDRMKSFYEDPTKATAAARNLVGDEADGQAITRLSQDMFKLGRFAKLFSTAINLGTYVFKEFAFITDALVAGFGAANATSVTLTLGARPPSAAGLQLDATSRLRIDGIGPVNVGMTLDEASRVAGTPITIGPGYSGSPNCFMATAEGAPPGLFFMVVSGRIVRVDVGSRSIGSSAFSTVSGIRVGSTEGEVKQAYGDRIGTSPHPYVPTGHYLTYTPSSSSDKGYKMIFETNGSAVTSFRSGQSSAVDAIEGCL